MTTQGPAVGALGQLPLTASDLDRAVQLHRNRLGLRHLSSVPSMAFSGCGGIRLLPGLPGHDEPRRPGAVLHFRSSAVRPWGGSATPASSEGRRRSASPRTLEG